MATGFQVSLEFTITQHVRDLVMMNKLVLFFNCGYVALNKVTCQYRIRNINELEAHLFPLLDAYPLHTQKALDAAAFKQVHALIKAKQHLTTEGVAQIQLIKASMNRGRMVKSSKTPYIVSCIT